MVNLQRLITNGEWLGKRGKKKSIWNRWSNARRSLPHYPLFMPNGKLGLAVSQGPDI